MSALTDILHQIVDHVAFREEGDKLAMHAQVNSIDAPPEDAVNDAVPVTDLSE
jgi:hypothetical protein